MVSQLFKLKRLTWQRVAQIAHAKRERKALQLMAVTGTLSRSDQVRAAHLKHRQRFA